MTAHLYLVAAGSLAGRGPGDVIDLDGDEGHHAATVKRARVGEELLVADGVGVLARGVIESVGPGSPQKMGRAAGGESPHRRGAVVRVRIAVVGPVSVPGPRFVLAQALAKGGRDELAVETATELGVDEILPWQAARSIVSWRGDRGSRSRAKWQSTACAAAKQSRRALIPQVAAALTTAGLVERTRVAAATLVLHEDATLPLPLVQLPTDGDVLVVVGPEGGIDPDELRALTDAGAMMVRLGPEVLRASTAGPAALAVLCARTRWRAPGCG